MGRHNESKPRPTRLGHYTLVLAVVWTLVTCGFAIWDVHHVREYMHQLAVKEARTIFNKDQAFRFWATNHGGVYVPANELTSPNPNLSHISERDITTPSGKKLTLMNPAYMLRQVQEEFADIYQIAGHITSLKPLRLTNAPDAWERKSLEAFERGVKEVSAYNDINGEPHLRLMLPMRVKKGCLKCHGIQGYKEGDVRGGTSVSVPMKSYLTLERGSIIQITLSHIIIWLIGLCFVGVGYRSVSSRITERKKTEKHLRKETERTKLLLELYLQAPRLSDKELYDYALDKAVNLTESTIGFFHKVAEDQKTIIPTTWNSEALKGCTAAYETHYSIKEAGNWVDCVRRGEPIIYNDFSNSPNRKGLPEGHTPIKRFMSIPVMEGDKILYIFGVGNKQEDYEEHDVAQIQLVANELYTIMIQRNAEKALKESQERLSLASRSAKIGIWDWDVKQNILIQDSRMYELYGVKKEDLSEAYEAWTEGVHPDDLQHFEQAVQMAFKGEKEFDTEFRVLWPDGTIRHLEAHADVYRNKSGEPIRMVGATWDITERKKLEQQLVQSQKMEAVGTLTGGIAHDFNNLLTAIIGNAHLMLMTVGKDDPLRENIAEIIAVGERAADLTSQLLAFSRKQVIQPSVMDLGDVIIGLEKMLGRLIGEDMNLKMITESALWNVEIDPGQIEQVIVNLAVNARDAMPCGGNLTIETANVDLDDAYFHDHGVENISGSYVMLAVSDTGIGMDKKTRSRIFEPFFTTKEVGKGTGLGLSTVYGIVKQSDGYIWAYSEPGQGTTFKVYLPRVEKDAVLAEKENNSVETLIGSETILVVEDDDILRKMTRTILMRFGYEVLVAEEGEKALMISEEYEGRIHLLVTDVVMPGIGGRDLAERLLSLRPEVKVIYMSGYSNDAIARHRVLDQGVNFIQKPFSPESLANKVREVLNQK